MGCCFTVGDLISPASPPEWRVGAGSPNQCDEVERTLGTTLPSDYKLIINVYGSGDFNNLFHLFNPFSGSEGGNLFNQAFKQVHYGASSHLECYEEHQAILPDDCPFATLPEAGGLLPLGGNTWLSGKLPDCFNGAGKHFVNRTDPVFRAGLRSGMTGRRECDFKGERSVAGVASDRTSARRPGGSRVDTGGEFHPLLTRPVAGQRTGSSGSAPTASPPTTH
jgi:hypothetical protein